MLGIAFGQERKDPTISILRQVLCKIQKEFKVPVPCRRLKTVT